MSRVVLLAGGVGGARLLRGLVSVLPPEDLVVIANTADDDIFHGLHVSPDVDTLLYTLAGLVDRRQGWGISGDTFDSMDALARYGEPAWFRLGDRDLGTHLFRSAALTRGRSLTQITKSQAEALGVDVTVLPMSDDQVRTFVTTPTATLAFQEYLVRDRARARVRKISYRGIRTARPAPGVLGAISRARLIVFAPSNPLVSIGPILALRGVRDAIRRARAPVVAVSPLIGGRPVKGPADRMLRGLGYSTTPAGLVEIYRGLLDGLVIDESDSRHTNRLQRSGVKTRALPTLMSSPARARRVANETLDLGAFLSRERAGKS